MATLFYGFEIYCDVGEKYAHLDDKNFHTQDDVEALLLKIAEYATNELSDEDWMARDKVKVISVTDESLWLAIVGSITESQPTKVVRAPRAITSYRWYRALHQAAEEILTDLNLFNDVKSKTDWYLI